MRWQRVCTHVMYVLNRKGDKRDKSASSISSRLSASKATKNIEITLFTWLLSHYFWYFMRLLFSWSRLNSAHMCDIQTNGNNNKNYIQISIIQVHGCISFCISVLYVCACVCVRVSALDACSAIITTTFFCWLTFSSLCLFASSSIFNNGPHKHLEEIWSCCQWNREKKNRSFPYIVVRRDAVIKK